MGDSAFDIAIECPLMQASKQSVDDDEDAYDSSHESGSASGSDSDTDQEVEIVGQDIPGAPSVAPGKSNPVQPVAGALPALPSPPVESPQPSSLAAPSAIPQDLVQEADKGGGGLSASIYVQCKVITMAARP